MEKVEEMRDVHQRMTQMTLLYDTHDIWSPIEYNNQSMFPNGGATVSAFC